MTRPAPKLIVSRGRSMTTAQWAAEAGVSASTISRRMQLGATFEEALAAPDRAKQRHGAWTGREEMWQGARTARYADDLVAQTLVAARTYSQDEVGEMLGFSRRSIGDIEARALDSFRRAAQEMGLSAELCEQLAELAVERDAVAARAQCGLHWSFGVEEAGDEE